MNLQEIKKVLNEHLIWLESGGETGVRANLQNVDLKMFKYRGIDLANDKLPYLD